MAKVIFNVGVKHPLYNKVIEATILTRSGGYNRKTIEAITKEDVLFPSDPKGLFVMNDFGDIIGYKERPSYTDKWHGWVKEIVEDDVPQYFDAKIFDFNSGKHVVDVSGEIEPYTKGEEFEPIEGQLYKAVCVSDIIDGVQIIFAVNMNKIA